MSTSLDFGIPINGRRDYVEKQIILILRGEVTLFPMSEGQKAYLVRARKESENRLSNLRERNGQTIREFHDCSK